MRQKNYDQKRKEVKKQKRENKNFNTSNERRHFVEGMKREYRSIKRSERQAIQKEINDKVWGLDEEQFDPDEDKILD
jgi:hypothetical protein